MCHSIRLKTVTYLQRFPHSHVHSLSIDEESIPTSALMSLSSIACCLCLLIVLIVGVGVTYFVSYVRTRWVPQSPYFQTQPNENSPLIIAERGGSGLRPENTLIAFRYAANLGVDILHGTFQLTKDSKLALLDDGAVERLSNGIGIVENFTLAELQALDFGYKFAPTNTSFFPYRGQSTVVTVRELFKEFTSKRFLLESKTNDDFATLSLCNLTKSFWYEDRVLFNTPFPTQMRKFRKQCPKVATVATNREFQWFLFFRKLRLLGLLRPKYKAIYQPLYFGDYKITEKRVIAASLARGVRFMVSGVSDKLLIQEVVASGVSGISTEFPDRL